MQKEKLCLQGRTIFTVYIGIITELGYIGITRYKNIDIQSILYLQVKIGKLDN
jgi:hypothetical protein